MILLLSCFFIDANCNGSLADETPVTLEHGGRCDPVEIRFPGEEGPVSYHVPFAGSMQRGEPRLLARTACWYVGQITLNGKALQCMLWDINANGTFNDTGVYIHDTDRIFIGAGRDRVKRYTGKYAQLYGKLYRLEIARTGQWIRLTPADDIPMGSVRVPKEVRALTFLGPNGLFDVGLGDGVGRVPAGRYRILYWRVTRESSAGEPYHLKCGMFPDETVLDIREGEEVELLAGEPVTVTLEKERFPGAYEFRLYLRGQMGEAVNFEMDGSRLIPKLRISNADGSYETLLTFHQKDWRGDAYLCSWQRPVNFRGPFTATVEIDVPYEIHSQPYELRTD